MLEYFLSITAFFCIFSAHDCITMHILTYFLLVCAATQ